LGHPRAGGSGSLCPVQQAGEAALAAISVPAVQGLALCAIQCDHGAAHGVRRILRPVLDGLTRAPDERPDCSISMAIDIALSY